MWHYTAIAAKIEDGRTQNPRKVESSLSNELAVTWVVITWNGVRRSEKIRPVIINGTPSSQYILDNQAILLLTAASSGMPAHKNLSNHSEMVMIHLLRHLEMPFLANSKLGVQAWRPVSGISIQKAYLILVETNQKPPKNGDLIVAIQRRLQRSYL